MNLNAYLSKIGLIQFATLKIKTLKNDFVTSFKKNIDSSSTIFDKFSSNNKEYIGVINPDTFQLESRKNLLNFNLGLSIINGVFFEENENLIIKLSIKIKSLIYLKTIIFIMIYGVLIFEINNYIFIVYMLIQLLFIVFIVYYFWLRSVNNNCQNIERFLLEINN